jgi:hypothetical protein
VTVRSFQYLSGVTVLLTHIFAVAMIAMATRFADIRDQIGSILIVAPITLVYASAFLRYVVANASPTAKTDSSERFYWAAAGTMYLVVAVFCASLIYVVVKFTFLSSYQVNEFKMWLGAAETGFGALIAIVFDRLFGVQPTATIASRDASEKQATQNNAAVTLTQQDKVT